MKYYVVSDIHGYYDQLIRALEAAGFFGETQPCKLIVCGDLLDRGSQANELIAFMLELLQKGQLIYVLGNHEDLLVQCLQEIARSGAYDIAQGCSHHYRNKTWDTLLQISAMSEVDACNHSELLVRSVVQSAFYEKLLPAGVDYYETPHYIFTHGWIPCVTKGYWPNYRYAAHPNWREAGAEEWHRARWHNGMELACKHSITEPGKTIVCGHYHTSYGHACIAHTCGEWDADADFSPFAANGILAIDGCTAYSGRVNCVVIED